jgi:pimeloyl-ACP methyl ester carboxylesterase
MDRESDIDWVLSAIHVPTLLLHRTGDRRIGVEHSRYLAAHMPDATYVELPGEDHLPYIGDSDRVIAEMEAFLTALP